MTTDKHSKQSIELSELDLVRLSEALDSYLNIWEDGLEFCETEEARRVEAREIMNLKALKIKIDRHLDNQEA